MLKASKNDVIDSACETFRKYKYRFGDNKSIEKLHEAFANCQREIQAAGVDESTIKALEGILVVLNSKREEFNRIPWDPPLDTHPFSEYLQNRLLSMLQKSEDQNRSQARKLKLPYFNGICSLLDFFKLNFLFHDKFLIALEQCLTDIRDNQYSSSDFRYELLAMLFEEKYTVYQFKLRYYDIYQKLYPVATPLILQCILNYYEKEYKRFYSEDDRRASRMDSDAKYRVFLNVFPEYLLAEDIEIVKPTLTTSQLDILCQKVFEWSHVVFHVTFEKNFSNYRLSSFLIRFLNLMNYCVPSVYFRRCTRQNFPLVENILRLLHTPSLIKNITHFCPRFGTEVVDREIESQYYDLVIAATTLLYNLSVESCTANYLRVLKEEEKPAVIYTLYKESKKKNNNKDKFFCETLIGLMENDIDELEEPEELAATYVKYMSKAMNNQKHSFEKVRLSDAIIHLKIFIQNEAVKTEVVAQDGLTLLTKCATDHQFDMASIQYPSMELIWSIIFNLSAAQLLRANKVFVDYVIDLTKSTTDEPDKYVLKSVADGIDWQMRQHQIKEEKQRKAEKPKKLSVFGVPIDHMGRQITKEQRLTMEQAKEFKFDLMISYCHKDADLCIKIHKRLKDTTDTRIWIDTEQMFGSLTECMSEAIENSRIILVCYSNAYKESANCQSECTYANDLKRTIIPLRMESNYRPNGWLKIIIGDRLYVDFIKYDFETAFKDLIKQLERYDRRYKEMKGSHQPVNASASIAAAQSQKKAKEIRTTSPPPPKLSESK
ncbi:unnamed protein product, partial [Rotaria sp. Silwood2]